MKRTMILALLFVLLAAVMPIGAQDGLTADQQTSVDVVSSAIEALKTLDSYSLHSEQTISNITAMGAAGNVSSDISQVTDFQVQKAADGYNAAGIVQHSISTSMPGAGGAAGNFSLPGTNLRLEVIAVDGNSYIRVSFGDGTETTPNPMAAMLPAGWIDAGEGAGNPLLSAFGPEALERMYNQTIQIETSTILSIGEIAGEEVDGQGMRVFDITYNPETYSQSAAFAALSQVQNVPGGGSDIPSIPNMPDMPNIPNIPNMPEIPAIPPASDALPPPDIAVSLQVTMRAYVGANDGLLHRMDSIITYDTSTLQGTTVGGATVPSMVMKIIGSTSFSNFNQPVTIQAPTLGS